MICTKCRNEMEYKIENNTQGWYCSKCTNAIVTSYISKIDLDETKYEVILLENNDINIDNIKMLSKLTGDNFIKSKEILSNGGIGFSGLARDIDNKIKILKEYKIKYLVKPKYLYD